MPPTQQIGRLGSINAELRRLLDTRYPSLQLHGFPVSTTSVTPESGDEDRNAALKPITFDNAGHGSEPKGEYEGLPSFRTTDHQPTTPGTRSTPKFSLALTISDSMHSSYMFQMADLLCFRYSRVSSFIYCSRHCYRVSHVGSGLNRKMGRMERCGKCEKFPVF